MNIVVSGISVPEELSRYAVARAAEITVLVGNESAERLKRVLATADYYLLGGDEYLSAELIGSAPGLKAVAVLAAGASSFIDLDAALARGIEVRNTPGANAAAVSEFAVGQLLSLRRDILRTVSSPGSESRSTEEVSGSRIGVLGLGAIGGKVARILSTGFGCDVLYSGPSPKPELEAELGVRRVPVEGLFEESSTVIVCCPLTSQTESLIGSSLLRRGVDSLVGISDLRVFNLPELLAELDSRQLSAAALDASPDLFSTLLPSGVSSGSVAEHGLYLTPHIAARSRESWQRMVTMATEQLLGVMVSDEAR